MFEAVLSRNFVSIIIGAVLAAVGAVMMLVSKIIGLLSLHHDRMNEYLADDSCHRY